MSRLRNLAVITLGANATSFILVLVVGLFIFNDRIDPQYEVHPMVSLGVFWAASIPMLIALSIIAEIICHDWYIDSSGSLNRKRCAKTGLAVGLLMSAGVWFWGIDWNMVLGQ
ncbi:MAG: hypothetical protein P8Y12_00880 [Gammaproteobacteria bacterium]|jgi:ABC-type amino acid transport system permease subunit